VNQIAIKINLRWPNLNYSCQLVGRHIRSCDHHALYSLGGVRVPDFEIWPVIKVIRYSNADTIGLFCGDYIAVPHP
jgi:hypothetical protein